MTFLNQLPKLPEIICLSETRLTESKPSSVKIQGFNLYNQNSITKAGGFVLYVSKTLESRELLELNLNVKDCEDIWVGITCSGKEPLIVESVHRHRNNNLSNFECALISKIRSIKSRQQYIIMGNFNINYANLNSISTLTNYDNHINALGCSQLVNLPTRVTPTTSSVIDHIYVNMPH